MKRLLYFMALLLALGTVTTSCGKDDGPETDINADDPNDNDDDNNDGNNDDDNNGDGDTDTTLSITDFTPSESVGGTITITGENFGDDANAITVTFGGDVTADGVTLNGNTITLDVPEDAIDGPLTVTIDDQSATSTEEFDVIFPDPQFDGASDTTLFVGEELVLNFLGTLPQQPKLIDIIFSGNVKPKVTTVNYVDKTVVVAVPQGAQTGLVKIYVEDYEYEWDLTVRPTTYAVGFQENNANVNVATLWINEEVILLSNSGESSRARGVYVDGSIVYVVGEDDFQPKLWTIDLATGNTVTVDDLPINTNKGQASSVAVDTNGDVHIAGLQFSNNIVERRWLYWKKDGSVTATELPPQNPDSYPSNSDIDLAVASDGIYVIGNEVALGTENLNVWKDGLIDETLSLSGLEGVPRFRSIAVANGIVYIAGEGENGAPTLWVDGDMTVLAGSGDTWEVFVEGTDYYVAGQNVGEIDGHWMSGNFSILVVDGDPSVDTIFVHEGIVYLGGWVNSADDRANVWIGEDSLILGAEGADSRVYDLFVR